MRHLLGSVALALALSQVSSVIAAPRRCRGRTAWPGYEMGGNPWGAVVAPTKSPAEGVTSSSACSTSSAASAVSTLGVITTSLSNVFVPGTTSDPAPISTSSFTSSSIEEISTSSSFSTSSTVEEPSTSIFEEQTTSSDPPIITSTPEPTTSSEPPPPPPPPSSSPEPSPEPSSSEPPPPESTPDSSDDNGNSNDNGSTGTNTLSADVTEYLSTHNSVRAQHGASPLTWNDTLAAAAQRWSDGCLFQHSGGAVGPFGENLAAGTGDYTITRAVTSWTDEVSEYNPSNPSPSHFTQVVWKGTTQLGCAETTCAGGTIFSASSKYIVCEYFPQGNVIGAFAQNVQV